MRSCNVCIQVLNHFLELVDHGIRNAESSVVHLMHALKRQITQLREVANGPSMLSFVFLLLLHLGNVKIEVGNFKFTAILYVYVLHYLVFLWLWAGNNWTRFAVGWASHSRSLDRGLGPVSLLHQPNIRKGRGWGRGS